MEESDPRPRRVTIAPGLIAIRHLVGRCLGELREWRARRREAARYPDDFYVRLETALRQARRARTVTEVSERIESIEREIRDRGPLDEDFLPTLEPLHQRLAERALEPPAGGREA